MTKRTLNSFLLVHESALVHLLLDPHLGEGLLHDVVPVGQLLSSVSLEICWDRNLNLVRSHLQPIRDQYF